MNQFEYEATLRDYKEEGRAKGLAEGRAEGLAEGRDEARAQIARAMKAEGLSEDLIKKTTGVSPDAL